MRYLVIHWDPRDAAAVAAAREAARVVRDAGALQAASGGGGLSVFAKLEGRGVVTPWGRDGFIFGEAYSVSGGRPIASGGVAASDRPADVAALSRQVFGRYVAVRAGHAAGAFRDPSGGVDCLIWRVGPLGIASSDLDHVPSPLRPPRLGLDWLAITRCMASATTAMADVPFGGVHGVTPGALRTFAAPDRETLVWSPATFARAVDTREDADLCEDLRARLDLAIRALVGARERVAVEVSGGLDSAIVAGSIGALGLAGRGTAWLTYHAERPEQDERAYAQAVAARAGVALSPVVLPIRPLADADFSEVARSVRPPLNALEPLIDRAVSARLVADGACALVSGQGGDAAFFQMPTALVVADEMARHGLRALTSPIVSDVAGMLRRSIWQVLREGLRANEPPPAWRDALAAEPKAAARGTHPWNAAAADLPPAKRLQVIGLANAHVATGPRRMTHHAALLYPILAQPVMELCLAIPASVHQRGGRERALARRAFADRLPAIIQHRRKKGELSAFHAQTIAASLDFLRPYLLDGCLVDAGVVDRRRLERALTLPHLIHFAGGGEILMAAALEAWVRHWQCYVPDSTPRGRGPLGAR